MTPPGPTLGNLLGYRCPKCSSAAVITGTCMVTAVHCPPFVDEDGAMHIHDTNTTTQDLRCMNCQHAWTAMLPPRTCWCGWPEKDDHA